jgi:hypothetical protein
MDNLLFSCFVSAFFSHSLYIKPTSSTQINGTLTFLYGMNCCWMIEPKINPFKMFKWNYFNFASWHQKVLINKRDPGFTSFPNSSPTIVLKPQSNITWILATASLLIFLLPHSNLTICSPCFTHREPAKTWVTSTSSSVPTAHCSHHLHKKILFSIKPLCHTHVCGSHVNNILETVHPPHCICTFWHLYLG